MATDTVQKTVAAINWNLLKPVYEAKRQRPFLEEFDSQSQRIAEPTESIDLLRQLQDTAPSKRRDLLTRHIQSEVTRILGFNLNRAVDTQQGFFEMGMDSLTSVELKDRLEQHLGCVLHATVVFEYSSVKALAEYLENELFGFDTAEPSGEISADELGKDATALKDLSKDDLLALLAAELRDGQP
jgi:myxalamid-type polyketide synthase MxaC